MTDVAIVTRKDRQGKWEAKATVKLGHNWILEIHSARNAQGVLVTSSMVFRTEEIDGRVVGKQHTFDVTGKDGGDYHRYVERVPVPRATEKTVKDALLKALTILDSTILPDVRQFYGERLNAPGKM